MRQGELTGIDFDAASSELGAQARADLLRLEKQRPLVRALSEATRACWCNLPDLVIEGQAEIMRRQAD